MVKIQHVADTAAVPATYAASAGSVIFGLTTSEWQAVGVIGGLVIGTLTYLTTLYFRHKHYQLAKNKEK